MDRNSKPNGPRVANQSTHLGFVGVYLREEPCIRVGLREILADPPMVQAEDWALRLYTDESGELMVSRVRASSVFDLR